MVKLCLMASHGNPLGFVLPSEPGSSKVSKDCQPILRNTGPRQDMIRFDTLNVRPYQSEELWKPITSFPETAQFVKIDSTITKPVLINIQDTRTDSTLFSFGIAEQCAKHEKILQFLMAGSNEVDGGGLDLSMLSNLLGLDFGYCTNGAGVNPSIIYPSSEFYAQRSLVELVGNLAHRSEITLHSDGRISFTGASTEFKDMLSIVAEYYLSKSSTKWRTQSVLIPQFNWLDCSEATTHVDESSMLLKNAKFAPLKSAQKIKLKPSPKRKSSKKARERHLYGKNYFHACESLLSIMLDKKRNGKTAILSLKKSCPELPELLMQFSASIAGTGLAVLFSVIQKVTYSRVPFCTSKLLNTGIGFGLVWLSWEVSRLRDTVVYISKSSGKLNMKEEEMTRKLDRCVKEVFFRAATLIAVAVLRLA
ncbi:ATP-dependent RNA helicase [Actinidia chinensis var. chinensis]|uniref:ATP-dependent RNA helicase n=1 Tax=Actinidia chinensis var. chinensis TaxID=1590841 RepID=A0A2R6P5V4_ACTCC|nr:ATP-dependent RNA helicase [Actinidia chinensis var. chinensis]